MYQECATPNIVNALQLPVCLNLNIHNLQHECNAWQKNLAAACTCVMGTSSCFLAAGEMASRTVCTTFQGEPQTAVR